VDAFLQVDAVLKVDVPRRILLRVLYPPDLFLGNLPRFVNDQIGGGYAGDPCD
jgi:hypothetical protein